MEFYKYQYEAMQLRLPSASSTYALLGLPGEVGEVCSLVAKAIRDGSKPDHVEMLQKEIGDCLWMLSAIAADANIRLSDCAERNLVKLRSRKERGTLQGSGDTR